MKALTPILCLMIAGAIGYMYISPEYEKIKVLRDTTTQYETAVDRAIDVGKKRDDLARRYNSFDDEEVARLQKLLPDKADSIKFLVDLNAIAGKYGSTVRDIKPGDDKGESKTYGTLSTSFTVSMSYENYLRFLQDLQQNLRLTEVSSIQFKSGKSNIYDYNVTVKNYWLK